MINAPVVGFGLLLLISSKLKEIIGRYANNKCQFFRSPVLYERQLAEDYWILHPYHFDIEYIDFTNSTVFLTENVFKKIKQVDIKDAVDFVYETVNIQGKNSHQNLSIEKFKLAENTVEDF